MPWTDYGGMTEDDLGAIYMVTGGGCHAYPRAHYLELPMEAIGGFARRRQRHHRRGRLDRTA